MRPKQWLFNAKLTATGCAALLLLATASAIMAQEQAPPPAAPSNIPVAAPQPSTPPSGGWRRFGDQQRPRPHQAPDPDSAGAPAEPEQAPPPQASGPLPGQITVQTGAYLTVRLNEGLSSDHSQTGQIFTGTLVKPVVVDGIVVARRGQIVTGRVVESQKAGRVTGVSKLGVQLTDVTLVDGTQLPVQTSLLAQTAGTTQGRDAAGIATTTGVGAAIGAAAGGGVGAGIGAGAGAVAGVVGVLLTRGHPTVIYPESVLTFRMEAPMTVVTDRAPQAFRYVQQSDYGTETQPRLRRATAPPPPYGYAPYPYPYYPYYGGVSVWVGPGWGYGGYGGYRYGGYRYGGYRGGYRR